MNIQSTITIFILSSIFLTTESMIPNPLDLSRKVTVACPVDLDQYVMQPNSIPLSPSKKRRKRKEDKLTKKDLSKKRNLSKSPLIEEENPNSTRVKFTNAELENLMIAYNLFAPNTTQRKDDKALREIIAGIIKDK